MLQCVVVCCSVLQCVEVQFPREIVPLEVPMCFLQGSRATECRRNVLQRVAAYCSVAVYVYI